MYISGSIVAVLLYLIIQDGLKDFRQFRQLNMPELPKSNSKVWLCDGIYHNFNKHTHLSVSGHTGYGKTNIIKVIMEQINGEIVLVDLKGGIDYDNVSCTEIEDAVEVLEDVAGKLKQLNRYHTFVIIDEAYEMQVPAHMTRKEGYAYLKCQQYVSEIARLGRASKVHLIYATQYPTREVLPGQIKQNCESRVVFRLPTEIASRVALDEMGAEELPGGLSGRAIYKTDRKVEIQTYLFEKGRASNAKVRTKKEKGSGNTVEIG